MAIITIWHVQISCILLATIDSQGTFRNPQFRGRNTVMPGCAIPNSGVTTIPQYSHNALGTSEVILTSKQSLLQVAIPAQCAGGILVLDDI